MRTPRGLIERCVAAMIAAGALAICIPALTTDPVAEAGGRIRFRRASNSHGCPTDGGCPDAVPFADAIVDTGVDTGPADTGQADANPDANPDADPDPPDDGFPDAYAPDTTDAVVADATDAVPEDATDAAVDSGEADASSSDSGTPSAYYYDLDGTNEYLSCTDNAAYACAANGMTACAWFYPNGLNANDTIFAQWKYSTLGQWALQTSGTSGSFIFYVLSSVTDTGNNRYTTGTGAYANTTWQLVCVRHTPTGPTNATRMQLWVNDVEKTGGTYACNQFNDAATGVDASNADAGSNCPVTMANSTTVLTVGDWDPSGSLGARPWAGKIDDAFMVCSSLSTATMTTLYNGGTPLDRNTVVGLVGPAMFLTADGDSNTTSTNYGSAGGTCGGNNMESGDIHAYP